MLLAYHEKGIIEAGCDEAGRGCLAGPVVAGAVILPENYENDILNDSKQLSKTKRDILRMQIKTDAISWAVAEISHEEIDQINILNASFLAMHRAIDKLKTKPEALLIDGNRFKAYKGIPHSCMIKGDGRFLSIAAASVLAKTYRDELMENLAEKYPQYSWKTNVGYPTIAHRQAIREHGITPYHRKSFRLLPEQMELF